MLGALILPEPPRGRVLLPHLEPLFPNAEGEAGRMFLLRFRADRARHRSDLPGTNEAWVDALRTSPLVARVWSDEVFSVSDLPNDPYLLGSGGGPAQRHLWNPGGLSLQAVRAWPFVPAHARVSVAIIDTGVDWMHPDLGGPAPPGGVLDVSAAEASGIDEVDDDGNGYPDDRIGWDFVDLTGVVLGPGQTPASGEDGIVPDADPSDQAGHGTQVAGLVNALTRNAFGIAGASPPARLLPVRVGWRGSDGGSYVLMSFCAQGLRYAAENGARVANCSWDSANLSGLGQQIAFAADTMDVVIVGSAGNNGTSSTAIQFLASHPSAVGVAGIEASGQKAVPSNFGSWVDLAAFYRGMPTTDFDYGSQSSTIRVNPFGGTSFSAPQVSALAALLRAVSDTASAPTVRAIMKNTARPLDDVEPTYASQLGGGLADYARAVQVLGGGWDIPRHARGLLPQGATLASRTDSTIEWIDIQTGATLPGWETGWPVAIDDETSPLVVDVSGLEPLLVWKEGNVLAARTRDGVVPPGWPVSLLPDAGAPVLLATEVGWPRILVPGVGGVRVLTVASTFVTTADETWSFRPVAAWEPEAALQWLAGVRDDGRLQAIVIENGIVEADTVISVGPDLIAPMIGELEAAGFPLVIAAASDSTSPGDTQRVIVLSPFSGLLHDLRFQGPKVEHLSLAGFSHLGRLDVVVADVAGGIHVFDPQGNQRSVAAGGPLASEVLCADVDGDFQSDLIALRRDGTLLAWDAALVPLPAFPRFFPYGASESPAILDGATRRFVAVADTAGGLWSVPIGPPFGPAPWPAASGGAGRSRAMGFFEGTPVEPRVHALAWKWETERTGSLCWAGTNLSEVFKLRVRQEGARAPVADMQPTDEGCIRLEGQNPGERLILEGQDRSGVWSELSRLVIEGPARLLAGMPLPNPFRAETRFTVTGAVGPLSVRIVDIQGRVVWEGTTTGQEVRWPGTDLNGRRVPPGLYFVRVTDQKTSVTRRVLRL